MPPRVLAVLLDIDDTLVDTKAAFRSALTAVAEVYLGSPADLDAMGHYWRSDASGWYRAHARGEMSHRDQRMRRANELHAAFGGPQMDDGAYEEWNEIFEAGFRAGWKAHEDVVDFLDLLDRAGLEYGAVSNAESGYQEMKLAAVGLKRVRMLVGTDRFGVGKPDPRVFLEGARMLGVPAHLVAYVGDERDIDANAAVDAGLGVGIWLDRAGGHPQPGELKEGAVRVSTLAEVAAVLDLGR